ncbi:phage tail protein [Pseudomonas fluorescens]|uniref:phage tail protein n=1 Tax=Pseudomonas fluorescens TaxID=294 RepID=UPI003CFFD4E8
MFYSADTRGFYSHETHGDTIPLDAVEITDEQYGALLEGQSIGKLITGGEDGYPVLVDPPPQSPEFFAAIERAWRDGQLAVTDGVVSRHRDELEEGSETTLTPTQYAELQAYRRALRNWPEAGEFPLIEHRPSAPPWMAEKLQ